MENPPTIEDYRRALRRERAYLESLAPRFPSSFIRPIADRVREYESAVAYYEAHGRLPEWALLQPVN